MNAKTPIFTIVVVLVMHTVTLAQAINQGASPSQPDIVVNFDVDNPNVTIYAVMPGDGGQNSTDAYAEFTLNGTGGAGGSFIAYSNGGTGWAGVSGEYIAWSGDFSSTFKAEGVRTNSTDLNSTFTVKQGLDATGVGGLSFSPTTGNLTGGFYVIGETGACAIGDTWALGMTESFVGSAESLTVTLGREFEQRSNDGTIAGSPRSVEVVINADDGDTFSGVAESGSYDAVALGMPSQPGFGFAMSTLTLEAQGGAIPSNTYVQSVTDKIVGDTSTWYAYPGYGVVP